MSKIYKNINEKYWRKAAWARFREIRALIHDTDKKQNLEDVRWYKLISYSSMRPTSNTFQVTAEEALEQELINDELTEWKEKYEHACAEIDSLMHALQEANGNLKKLGYAPREEVKIDIDS